MVKFFVAATLIIGLLTGCVNQHPAEESVLAEERIVATSVAVCEILDALEVDSVVGIPQTSAYTIPKRYEECISIGSPMAPDLESLSTLNPTLILSPGSLEGDLAIQYEELGINSAFLNLTSVEGMFKSIQDLGTLLEKEEQAKKLVEEFQTFMEEYTKNHSEENAPTVLILMGLPGSYVVATENSYVGNLVKMAGGINVYQDETEDFVNVSTEDMLKKNPNFILRTSHALPDQVQEMFEEEFKSNDIWSHFEAVQNGDVVDLGNELFGMSANFKYQQALIELDKILFGAQLSERNV